MKAIYKFNWDCRRMGDLEGMFIAKKADVDKTIGKEIHFGEVLGKHSDIRGILEKGDLTVITENQRFIEEFEQIIGIEIGYNPLNFVT